MIYNKEAREEGNNDIEKLHKVLLEMLKVIDNICRKHKLCYWLDAGNLLGHVRHNGFIPWDDDIDLAMPREDYEKFLQVAPNELPKDLFFQYKNVDAKKSKWVKIRDNYSTVVMDYELGKSPNYHQGIFLDIFPYDLLEDDFRDIKIIINRRFKKARNPLLRKSRWLLNQTFTLPVKAIGMERLKKYFLNRYCGPNPKIVSMGIEIPNFYHTFDYSTVFPLKEIDFLGIKVYAPNDIDKYLTDMYGNYMKIPDKNNRVIHAKKIMPYTKCNHPSSIEY
ncbi:LicD family protein [Carboxylicivirga sediminis]|uniref:LicD family protein n=1 Tax=Carboxylicivirga sediminis TaxID=2006564 RepID=A0A941IWV1_9BACT|nr:LicD family protein [Carboxylicivirga sediminis]MBR8535530.1 LicD family protein [Carboxylicivirga sediminis]